MTDTLAHESLTDVWIIWALSVAAMTVLIYRGLARIRWRSVRRFHTDQRGASYALPYVLTFPWIVLLTCLMIQGTLILLVKFGTIYAAYAAARSAAVWQASDPESKDRSLDNGRYHAERAAMLAMTPFASGYESHLEQIFPGVLAQAIQTNRIPKAGLDTIALNTILNLYNGFYERTAQSHQEPSGHSPIIRQPNALAEDNYVRNKLIFAALATNVTMPDDVTPWNQDVTVTVKYVMPMHIPGAGRVLGNKQPGPWWAPDYFAREISSTVTLPSESPQTSNHRLNVPYFPSFMTRYLGL